MWKKEPVFGVSFELHLAGKKLDGKATANLIVL